MVWYDAAALQPEQQEGDSSDTVQGDQEKLEVPGKHISKPAGNCYIYMIPVQGHTLQWVCFHYTKGAGNSYFGFILFFLCSTNISWFKQVMKF